MAIAYFNVVYLGTGSSYTANSSSIAITTPINGRGFVYTQGTATTGLFAVTSSNVLGTLSYVDEATGATVSISGNLTRKVSSGSTVEGFYFHDGLGHAYLMMVPASEGNYTAAASVSTNSAPFVDDLNALVTLQATQPVISVSSPSESEGHGFVEFTVSLSHAANADISFAPELHDGTATVAGGDYAGLQYWTGLAWATVSGSVTIAQNALSVRLRAVVLQDVATESNETFTLQTGAITGGNVTNNGGAFGTATIVDDDQSIGLNATTNNGLVTVTITGLTAAAVLTINGPGGVVLDASQYSATWNSIDSTWSVKLLDAQVGAGTTSDPFGTYFNGALTGNSTGTGDGVYTVLNSGVSLGGFTIDTTAPAAPVITNVTELAGDANPADLTTNDNTQVLTVTGETGGTIKVYTTAGTLVAPALYSVTESSGTYTVDFGTNVLAEGSYNVKLTDAGGNVSAASSAFVIDTSSPPYISGTDVKTVTQGQSVAISGFTIGDADSATVTVRIQAAHGTLSLATPGTVGGYSGSNTTLVFDGSVADVNAALNTLRYLADANYSGTDPLVLEISDDGGASWEPYTWRVTGKFYNPANGHYYEAVTATTTWAEAQTAAAGRTLNGLTGYLATITSAEEQQFILDNIGNVAAWMGASDETAEGDWKWVTGPEAGTSFWSGAVAGTPVSGQYTNWDTGSQPDNYNNEDYGQLTTTSGKWNDLPGTYTLSQYVVEYGGTGFGTLTAAPLTVTVTLPPDDYLSTAATTGAVPLNGSATGVLEFLGDEDWFAVTLTAGQTYDFQLNAADPNSLDTWLVLYSATGVELSYDDDSGAGRNSLLSYTATSSGTYYLGARAFEDRSKGAYTLSALDVTPPVVTAYDMTDATDTGSAPNDERTRSGAPVLTFASEAGLTVTLLGADGTTVLTEGTHYSVIYDAGAGLYKVTLLDAKSGGTASDPFGTNAAGSATGNPGATADGTYTIQVADAAGNKTTAGTFVIDTTAPAAPTLAEWVTTDISDGWMNAAEALTTTFRATLPTTGSLAVEGDQVELLLGGAAFGTAKTVTLSAADIANGYVDFTVLKADLGAEGAKSLTARITDVAGNVGGASNALAFSLDTVLPTQTSFATLANGVEDTTLAITYADLLAAGNEVDTGSGVAAFIVTGPFIGGTLEIFNGASYVPWVAGTNDVIDATHPARWIPDANVYGLFNAFKVTAQDVAGNRASTPVQATIYVTNVNDAPGFWQPGNGDPVNTVNAIDYAFDGAVKLAPVLNILDIDLGGLNSTMGDYGGASVRISRTTDGTTAAPSAMDLFYGTGLGSVGLVFSGGNVFYDGIMVGLLTNTAGTLTITFSANATQARVDAVLKNIGYAHAGESITGEVKLLWVFSDTSSSRAYTPGGVLYTDQHVTTVTLKIPESVTASGTAGDDVTNGGVGADRLYGLGGKDILRGAAGNDLLDGGAGVDQLFGGEGSDLYIVASSADHTAAEFNDIGTGSGDSDEVRFTSTTAGQTLALFAGDVGIEQVVIGTGTSTAADSTGTTALNVNAAVVGNALRLVGNAGINSLTGTVSADTLDGGAGADRLIGGLGNDIYYVDNTGDVVSETSSAGGTDTVYASVSYTLATNVEHLELTGSGDINATGNILANNLTGNDGANVLNGGAGVDTLDGAGGSDIYLFALATDHTAAEIKDTGAGSGDSDEVRFAATTAGQTLNLFAGDTGIERVVIGTGLGATAVTTGTTALSVNASAVLNALTMTGNAGINTLTGTNFGDAISAGAGNDVLVGGGGTDALDGQLGSDLYVFASVAEHSAAEINDTGSSGIDEVRFASTTDGETLVLFAGDIGLERVTIGTGVAATAVSTGTTALDVDASLVGNGLTMVGNAGVNSLVGTGFNDVLDGGAGNDTLNGGAGADRLTGGLGNDTYYLDHLGDTVSETSATGGTDLVYASVSFTLGANVEHLTLTGGAAADAFGNTLANQITGNDGANVLNGGAGNDTLTGGAGADTFYFNTTPNAAGNLDTITDFVAGLDKLQFSKAVFAKLGALGALDGTQFVSGNYTAGQDLTDRIVYNTTTGALYYDADGSGLGAAVQVALLVGAPAGLSASDIFVV